MRMCVHPTMASVALCLRSWSQCKKIVDTPFPYPYAQSVMLMVCLYTILAPFLVCQIVNSARPHRLSCPRAAH